MSALRGRIFFDARKIDDYGIGRSIQSLLHGLLAWPEAQTLQLAIPEGYRLPSELAAYRTCAAHARGYSLREHFELAILARQARADLYHTPHYVLPACMRRPAVVTIHDAIHLSHPELLQHRAAARYARLLLTSSYKRAARVLTVSQASKSALLAQLGGAPERIAVVPNALDPLYLSRPTPAVCAALRERLSLPANFILYVGNIKEHKNLPRLLEAYAVLRQRQAGFDFALLLAGAAPSKARPLLELAAELGIAQQVRSLGWLAAADLRTLYACAAAFVFPSLIEGFGLPPLEALATGLPTLISQAPALSEVCGEAALVVDATDVDALAHGLERLCCDAELRRDLASKGPTRARQFPLAAQALNTLQVWRSVLAEQV